jgi:glycosyltransferase involved in cell wall biosynthesis
MTPLHGLSYLLDAAVRLKDRPDIIFNLVGGKEKGEAACKAAIEKGAHVQFDRWIEFEEIAKRAKAADLTLGGPFGKTLQSQFVITGKTYQFLAVGVPVLVGKNAVAGLFQDKQNCLLVEPADPQAIVDAILWASEHPRELQKIGTAGRELYEEHFSQTVVNTLVREIVAAL